MNLKCKIKLPEGYGSYMKEHPKEWASILMDKNDDGSIDGVLTNFSYGKATVKLQGGIITNILPECIELVE